MSNRIQRQVEGEQGATLISVIGAVVILAAMLAGIVSSSAKSSLDGGKDAKLVAGLYNAQTPTPTPTPFGYVIFSNGDMDVEGSDHQFNGNVHVNGNLTIAGSNNDFNEVTEVYEKCAIKGSSTNNVASLKNPCDYVQLPQINSSYYQQHATKICNSDLTLSGSNIAINGIIFVNGNVNISGSKISGTGTIVATGSITVSGASMTYSSPSDSAAFYSMHDIDIRGAKGTFDGLFYAPSGAINLEGSQNTYDGALVAQSFQITGAKQEFDYDSKVANYTVNN